MRRVSVCVALGWFIPVLIYAQNPRVDSLQKVLKHTQSPAQRCDVLHALAAESWDYDFEKAYGYAQEAWVLARQNQYGKGEVQALTDIGLYHYFTGNYPQATARYREALRRCGSHRYGDFPGYTMTRLANLYRVQAMFDSADYYYKRAMVALKDQSGPARSSVYYNRGLMALNLSEFDSALFYFRESAKLRGKDKDISNLMESWQGVGQAYKGRTLLDSARLYYDSAYHLALKYKNPEQQMFYHINTGELLFALGDYNTAIRHFSQALEMLKRHPFRRYYALVLSRIAQVYTARGDYKHAIEHLLDALRIQEKLNNKQEIGRLYGSMAWVYTNQKNDSLGVDYAQRSLKIMEDIHDCAGISYAHNALGYIQFTRSHYKEALHHYEIALQLRKEIKSPQLYSSTTFNIARVYQKQGNFARARVYLVQALALDKANRDRDALIRTYNTLGELSIKTKQHADVENYLNQARTLATELGAALELKNNDKLFADYYRSVGDYPRALTYYDRYMSLNDSIFTQQGAAKIAEMSAFYELEKKESEIQQLNQKNELSQNEIQLQKAEISLQRSYLTFSIGGLLLLGLMAYMFYLNAQLKSKANKDLKRLNTEIKEQKEEIQAQSEELTEANNSLVMLNNELIEKTEEVQAQAEELRETNEMITEINRDLDNIVTKRTSQLQEAFKELDTFFYRSSHDFRRPLTTFMGLAEVAKITLKDPAALELFAKVNETAFSLDKMLIKLQSISDVGAQQLIFREVWVKEIFDSVCDSFREDIQKHRIKVKAQVDLKAPFISYPIMVRIILENLVENAIHFCLTEDPYIYLRARQEGDQLIMELEDNGQGIPAAYTEKVFDMYFRANERSKGNGLGLYIVKKAVGKLNGHLDLVTRVGKGSRFIITLPMNRSAINKF